MTQKPFQYGLSLSFPQDLSVDVTRGAVDGRFFRTLTAKRAHMRSTAFFSGRQQHLNDKGIRGSVVANMLIYNTLLKQIRKFCRPVLGK